MRETWQQLKLEVKSKDLHEIIFALNHTLKLLEDGYTSGRLENEDIDFGYFELEEVDLFGDKISEDNKK